MDDQLIINKIGRQKIVEVRTLNKKEGVVINFFIEFLDRGE